MRDRLVELIGEARSMEASGIDCKVTNEYIADFLLSEGVIVPPVKVGQTVYSKKGNAYVVEGIHYKNGRFLFGGNKDGTDGMPQQVWLEKDIGKTVFLTREEAEKAIAERRNDVNT